MGALQLILSRILAKLQPESVVTALGGDLAHVPEGSGIPERSLLMLISGESHGQRFICCLCLQSQEGQMCQYYSSGKKKMCCIGQIMVTGDVCTP